MFIVELKLEMFSKSIFRRLFIKEVGPVKKLFSLGITAIKILANGDILIGSGEGKLAKISIQNMALIK